MFARPFAVPLVGLITLIFLLNTAGEIWHLYYFLWWYDIPMHLLGGFWVGLAALAFHFRADPPSWSRRKTIGFALAVALTIGLGWELYEFALDTLVSHKQNDILDTLDDLLNDGIGSLCAGWVFLAVRARSLTSSHT